MDYYIVKDYDSDEWIFRSKEDLILGAGRETIGETADRLGLAYQGFWAQKYLSEDTRTDGASYDLDDIPYTEDGSLADKSEDTPLVISLDLLTQGDYGGCGALGQANREAFIKALEEEGFTPNELGGWYGHRYLPLPYDLVCPEISELIEALEDYHCLDEERMSEIEEEWKQEAITNSLGADLIRAIEERLHVDIDDVANDQESALFWALEQEADEYWSIEYSSAYIDVDKLAEACTCKSLEDKGIEYTLNIGPNDYDVLTEHGPCPTVSETARTAWVVEVAREYGLDTTAPLCDLADTLAAALTDSGYPNDSLAPELQREA